MQPTTYIDPFNYDECEYGVLVQDEVAQDEVVQDQVATAEAVKEEAPVVYALAKTDDELFSSDFVCSCFVVGAILVGLGHVFSGAGL